MFYYCDFYLFLRIFVFQPAEAERGDETEAGDPEPDVFGVGVAAGVMLQEGTGVAADVDSSGVDRQGLRAVHE